MNEEVLQSYYLYIQTKT